MDILTMRQLVQNYKDTYFSMYGHSPPEKCVESFCKIHGIPWPVPRVEKMEKPGEDFWRDNPIDG